MNRKLVFATNNKHKLKEIKSMLNDIIQVVSLADIGCTDELPETSASIRGNALQKARYIFEKFGMDCFADDTGLEVEALGGRPGVYSARYAGNNASSADNVTKLLHEMKGIENRKARFKTVIALITDHEEKSFEGIIDGVIADKPVGENGFGYDPVFIPDGSTIRFAEMSDEEKNKISHRKRALEKLVEHLKVADASGKSN